MTDSSLPAASLVERLAQQLSTHATAQTVYGTPVTHEHLTIIPVGRVCYGLGGGGGHAAATTLAEGGGAGVVVTPIGYIELRADGSRFRRIRSSVVPLVAVSGAVAWLLLRSVPALLSAARR